MPTATNYILKNVFAIIVLSAMMQITPLKQREEWLNVRFGCIL